MHIYFPDRRFGCALRARRQQLGLTLEQLASAADLSEERLQQLEDGSVRELEAVIYRMLIKALAIAPDEPFPPMDT